MIADYSGSQKSAILKFGIDDADSALDVGCGNGEKTFHIAKNVQFSVGIDPDVNQIQEAKINYISSNLAFQVAKAESLCFADSSFSSVLFNESLHHVRVDKQAVALEETYRVLKPGGKLLIIEPIFGSGSFGKILNFFNDEKEQKQSAINAIESMISAGFNLAIKKKIRIEYHFKGFDDLNEYHVTTKPSDFWSDGYKKDILGKLNRCCRSQDGGFILDYSAVVWLLINSL